MVTVSVFVVLSAMVAVGTRHTLTSEAFAQPLIHSGHEPGLHTGHEAGQAFEPVVNGSARPEDIPDSVAIRALMLTLRVPADLDSAALRQVRARASRVNLSDADFEILVRELGDFDTRAKAQETRIEAVRSSLAGAAGGASARYLEDRYVEEQASFTSLVEDHYQQLLGSLSPEGAANLQAHLLHVKSRIKIYAMPDMSKQIL